MSSDDEEIVVEKYNAQPDVPAGAVLNAEGAVAMKVMNRVQVLVVCRRPNGEKVRYVLRSSANVCMAWIDPIDVPCMGAVRGGCCGRRKRGIIMLANANDVRQWTNRGGR